MINYNKDNIVITISTYVHTIFLSNSYLYRSQIIIIIIIIFEIFEKG